jgi:group II intron reverse transcriptase/maturase
MTIRPRATGADGKRHASPYQWVIEGDIKNCFDRIDHHLLMQRVRQRVADRKVIRLLVRFLKAGVLEEQFFRTPVGTPQGGVISPLLANIALSAIEERYERWVNHQSKIRACRKSDGVQAANRARCSDRRAGRPVFFPVRYADDFVVLVSGSREDALAEKDALGVFLRETLCLELSPEKTKISSLMDGFEFLGHRIRLRWDPRFGLTPRLEIPKARQMDLRHRVKQLTKGNRSNLSLSCQLTELSPVLRGWGNFYRFCTNAKAIFSQLDWYVRDRLWRWMRKKYPKAGARWILLHCQVSSSQGGYKVWTADSHEQFLMGRLPVRRYRRGWMRIPDFAMTPGEPDA